MEKARPAFMTILICMTIVFYVGAVSAETPQEVKDKKVEELGKEVGNVKNEVKNVKDDLNKKIKENKNQIEAIKSNPVFADKTLNSCRRDPTHAVYTNDLPSWSTDTFGGEWTVGTAISAQTLRYDFAKKKASFNTGVGVGASFRFYRDVKTVDWSPSDPSNPDTILKLHQIKAECRASSLREANENTIATPMFSITPTIYASQFEDDNGLRVEPAIMVGFYQDIINFGVGFNLSGKDGDVGDVFALFSLGFGFNFGGEDNSVKQPEKK